MGKYITHIWRDETGKVQISPYFLYYIKRAYNRYINKRKVLVDRRVYVDITNHGNAMIIGEFNDHYVRSQKRYWERRAYWALFIHVLSIVASRYLKTKVTFKLIQNVSIQQCFSKKRYKRLYKIQARLTTKEPILPDSDYVFTINRESDWRLGTTGKYSFFLSRDYTEYPEDVILYFLQGGDQYHKDRPRKQYDKPKERILQHPWIRRGKEQKLMNFIKSWLKFQPEHIRERILQELEGDNE